MNGFVREARRGLRGRLRRQPRRAAVLVRRRAPGRDGLPRRARDPELLGLRAPLRAPGPHVPAGHLVEPAGAPVHGLGVVGPLPHARDRRAASTRSRTRWRRRTSRRTRPAASRTTPGPTSPTCCTSTTSPGATSSSRARSPTATTAAWSASRCKQNAGTPGIWNPLPWFDTVKADHELRNIVPMKHLFATGASAARCRRSRGSIPSQRVSEHPPALVTRRPDLRHERRQRDHAQPGLELDRDLPRLGRLGRLLRPRRAAEGGRQRLRPARARARDLARTRGAATSTTRC